MEPSRASLCWRSELIWQYCNLFFSGDGSQYCHIKLSVMDTVEPRLPQELPGVAWCGLVSKISPWPWLDWWTTKTEIFIENNFNIDYMAESALYRGQQ